MTTHPVPEPSADTAETSPCPVVTAPGRFIPYVVPLKGERPISRDEDVVLRPDGLGVMFRDEVLEDRDRHGALWVRMAPPGPGRTIPIFRQVQPRRAAAVMLDMRCQGCNGEPDRNRQGTLFFLKQPTSRRRTLNWPDVEYTHHPPICLPCVQQAMAVCSFVQTALALRVRRPRAWGIDCFAFQPRPDGTLRINNAIDRCAYEDLKLLPWTLALQPIARLSGCTVVDIRAELAAAGLKVPPTDATPPTGDGTSARPVTLPARTFRLRNSITLGRWGG